MKKPKPRISPNRFSKPKPARPMRAIEKELWQLCRELTFAIHGRASGVDCYTCPARNLVKQNRQCGHGYPKGALGASMKYDLRILRPQCYHCNINLGGMGAVFWNRLELELGPAEAQNLYVACQRSKGLSTPARGYYTLLIEQYRGRIRDM